MWGISSIFLENRELDRGSMLLLYLGGRIPAKNEGKEKQEKEGSSARYSVTMLMTAVQKATAGIQAVIHTQNGDCPSQAV